MKMLQLRMTADVGGEVISPSSSKRLGWVELRLSNSHSTGRRSTINVLHEEISHLNAK